MSTSALGTPSSRVLHPTATGLLVAAVVAAWLALTWLVGLRQGLLFGVGIGFGAVLGGVSFGFTTGWRAWIRDRDPTGLIAQFVAIGGAAAVSVPLVAAHPELAAAAGPLSWSLLLGAFVFGAVMQVADGCGSGTLYKAGLGNGFSLAVLPGFVLGSFLGASHLPWWLGWGALPPVVLQDHLGAATTVVVQLAILGTLGALAWRFRRALGTRWTGSGVYVGALLLAALAVANLLVAGQPWGIVYGLGLWGAKVALAIGVDLAADPFWGGAAQQAQLAAPVLADVTTVTNLGLLAGALLAGHLRGAAFVPVRATPPQWVAAAVSGLLLGYSARLAFGCNVGAYFSGIATGSLHGWVWFAAAFAGSVAGVRIRSRLGLKP